MAIDVSCECGKRLRAPDSSAGRRAKCPGCGRVLQVPSAPGDPAVGVKVAAPQQATPPPVPAAGAPAARPPAPRKPAPPPRARPAPAPTPAPAPAAEDDSDEYGLADEPRPLRTTVPAVTIAAPSAPAVAASHPYAAAPPAGLAAPGALPLQVRRRSWRGYLYLILLPALFPLAWSVLAPEGESVAERFERTVQAHPEVEPQVEQLIAREGASLTDLFNLLPGHRIEGAHLPKDTWTHWLYALLAAGAFFGLTLAAFPRGPADDTKPQSLLYVGLFTGTLGIVLLFAVQFAADASQGVWVRGRGIIVVLFYVVKFIGFSYSAALGDTNFVLSFLGFTCGVGLCEELVKAAPLLWHYRNKATLDWRGAARWGFISGVGFGVSEGISYSSNYYNGIEGPGIYVVRFVSCVTLHAVWSAAAGIAICRRQQQIQGADTWYELIGFAVLIVIVPMVLHGLYDTLLKKGMAAWALVTAAASFGWLAWQIEIMRKKERAAQAYGFPVVA